MVAQSFDILYQLLMLNAFQIDKEELQLQLLSHPSFPSLYSLAGVLQHFGIDYVAVHLPSTKGTLEQLPDNFIANIKADEKDQLVLVSQQRKIIKLRYSSSKVVKITIDQFLNSWTGVILAIERNKPDSGDRQLSYKHSILGIAYFLTAVLIGGIVWFEASFFAGLHFGSSIIGLLFSIIIIKHELGLQSPTVDKLCQLSERSSCSAILHSKGANLFGKLKLSDLSLIFFSALSLSWILAFITNVSFENLAIFITLTSAPMLVYSLYYQAVVVRTWCPLCLAIVGVLIVQFVLIFTQAEWFILSGPEVKEWGLFLSSILLSMISWDFLKPLLIKQQQLQKLQIEQYTFKRNFQVFNTFYQEGSILPENTNIEGDIILGNPDASLKLLLVTNPACYYCKEAHQDVERLLKKNEERLSLTIRFNVSNESYHHQAYQVASILLFVYKTEGAAACRKLLHNVYQEKVQLKEWLQKHSIQFDSIWTANTLSAQRSWCIRHNINFTPAFYLNNKLFPKAYKRADLQYFIDDLYEQQQVCERESMNVQIAN